MALTEVAAVAVPALAQAPLRALLANYVRARKELELYTQGVIDSMGLQGDRWELDSQAMVFRPEQAQVAGPDNHHQPLRPGG